MGKSWFKFGSNDREAYTELLTCLRSHLTNEQRKEGKEREFTSRKFLLFVTSRVTQSQVYTYKFLVQEDVTPSFWLHESVQPKLARSCTWRMAFISTLHTCRTLLATISICINQFLDGFLLFSTPKLFHRKSNLKENHVSNLIPFLSMSLLVSQDSVPTLEVRRDEISPYKRKKISRNLKNVLFVIFVNFWKVNKKP